MDQFRYWVNKELESPKSKKEKVGERKYNLKYRAVLNSSVLMGFGPGSMYMIDSTPSDIYLRNRITGKLAGRATIYGILDVFSQLITGFRVGFENASWEAARLALDVAFRDKVEYCREVGIDITKEQWPPDGLCESLIHDGGESKQKHADNLPASLGIHLAQTAPYRADWKGPVERFLLQIKDEIMDLPGAVDKHHERGDADYRLKAALDIDEFNKIMIAFILHYNKTHYLKDYPYTQDMVRDGVDLFPNDLWKWGIHNRTCELRYLPRDIIKLHLLPGGEASVQEKGIYFRGSYYVNDRATKEQWFEKARIGGYWKEPIAWDPRNTNTIYLRPQGARIIEICTMTNRTPSAYFGREWWEVYDEQADRKARKAEKQDEIRQSRIDVNAVKESIVKAASERTKCFTTGLSNASQLANIRKNRVEELAEECKNNLWKLGSEENKKIELEKTPINPPASSSKLNMFRKAFEKEEK